jgi:hypothetical protein
MADYRTVSIGIWDDDWFYSLSAEGKVLYLYLLTNNRTSVAGLYKLPARVMATETGIEQPIVKQLLEDFGQAGKIRYADPILWVSKMRDYQGSSSSKLQTRIRLDIDKIPDCDIKREYLIHYGEYCIDTVSASAGYPIDTHETKRSEPNRSETTPTRSETTTTTTDVLGTDGKKRNIYGTHSCGHALDRRQWDELRCGGCGEVLAYGN